MEACTLQLYKKNIFRITGLPVDATTKEIARQAQKLQMQEEIGEEITGSKPAFALKINPTSEEIRAALSRMKEPQHRLVDEFFWYWPEKFGESKNDPAIQAMMSGDAQGAINIWRQRQKEGSDVAKHNMAVMFHMYAVDWSLYHVLYDIDASMEDEIKVYWRKAFDRWEDLVDSDEIRDILKERIRAIGDDALTTGFVKRMLTDLPMALDMINAEAAFKLAERNRMEWARFHVDFMNETHQGLDDVDSTAEMILAPTKARVEQHLANCKDRTKKDPKSGTVFATELLSQCRPMMDLFDLFHGEDAHQRNDLFDKVAETVIGIAYADWSVNKNAQRILPIYQKALDIAFGINLRERIIEQISQIEGIVTDEKLAPIFQKLKEISDSKEKALFRLNKIKEKIISTLPQISQQYGDMSKSYGDLCDSIAVVLKGISVDAYNNENDTATALAAIQLALRLVRNPDISSRIQNDMGTLKRNTGISACFYCGKKPGDAKLKVEVPMHKVTERLQNGVRYQTNSFSFPRCGDCEKEHRKHWPQIWWGVGAGLLVGAPFAPYTLIGASMITALFCGGWITLSLGKHFGQIGIVGLLGTIAAVFACLDIAKEPMAKNLFLNALGGAMICGFAAFWIARQKLNPKSPQALAEESPQTDALKKEGWQTGATP
jgi:hypothetical protein